MNETLKEIFEYVNGIDIIDTHEHLPLREEERDKDTDFLKEYLGGYFYRDLISAGLSLDEYKIAIDVKKPLLERWNLIEKYWEVSRNTGYGRVLDISARDLYGVERIAKETVERLGKAFQESLRPGHFKNVLKKRSRIRVSLVDNNSRLDCDEELFRCIFRFDNLINLRTAEDLETIEKQSEMKVCSFDDWLLACEAILDSALKKGVMVLKSALAYHRTLRYERTTRHEAESAFNKIFGFKHVRREDYPVFLVGKSFQDFMMHYILRIANKANLTIQFHTGMQDGHGNLLYNSDPSLLSNLFLEYPSVDFDILHGSYPYADILAVLAKTFPNVSINMSWEHMINPSTSIRNLVEWIDAVPVNKISAFGGDFNFIDGVYGHQYLTRLNVSKALVEKIQDGVFDIDRAKTISEYLLFKNPARINKLEWSEASDVG